MALPRPVVLLALLGVALMAATFYTVRGAREAAQFETVSTSQAPVADKPAPAAKAAPSKAATRSDSKRADRSGKAKGGRVGLPAGVARALDRRDVVVLFFFQPGSADDAATARSVAAVRRGRRVTVVKASIRKLGRYQRLIGGLGVSQAPATVIVGRDRNARLLEGYVDERSLIQEVADSAR